MNKQSRVLVLFVLTAMLLSACAPRAAAAPMLQTARDGGAPSAMTENKALESEGMPASAATMSPMTSDTGGSDTIQRMVIMNADLSIVVDDPVSAQTNIAKMAETMGGFVVTSRLYKIQTEEGLEVPQANITIRVPAEKLNTALDQIKSLVKDPTRDIPSENVSGQDVTKEYTDLQSQLTNLQQAEKQLQKIMDQAVKIEDVLTVYNQLVQVRQQIEMIQGQMKYYKESASLSAISIQILSQASVAPLTIGSWQPMGTARNAVQALIDVFKFFTNSLIYIIILIVPTLLMIALPIWLVVFIITRLVRKGRKNKPTPPPDAKA